jgi:hypothetical protein
MATGARKTQLQAIHEISAQITPAMAAGIGGLIGVIPAGACLNNVHNVISQAFNSTTNTFGVGSLPPPGGANIQGGISGGVVIRSDNIMPQNLLAGQPLPADLPIYWTAAFTGAPPTTGLWTVWIDYLPGPG